MDHRSLSARLRAVPSRSRGLDQTSTPVPIKLRARKEIFSHFARLLKSGLDRTVTQLWSLGSQGQGAQRLESLATPMYFPRDTQHGPVVESLCPGVLCTQLDGDIWGHPIRARRSPTTSTPLPPCQQGRPPSLFFLSVYIEHSTHDY